jgi:hypothetical protein
MSVHDEIPTNRRVAVGLATPNASPTPVAKRRDPITVSGAWSEPVNGLSARLLVTYVEIASDKFPTYFHYQKLILEVKNVGSHRLVFSNQPSFANPTIRNAKGEVLHPPGNVDGNQRTGNLEWAAIPFNTYLGLRVDTAIPIKVGLRFESFVTENHSLSATLVARQQEGPKNQWVGNLDLPPVLLVCSRADLQQD